MPDKQTLELWIDMLETAQKDRVSKGLPKDKDIQEQLEVWYSDLKKIRSGA